MLTDLKVSTRRGYASVLDHTLVPRFGHLPVSEVDNVAAAALDLAYSKQKRTQGTRNNIQIVLRSVLRFAVWRGYIASIPTGLPRLKRIGQSILEIPTDDQVAAILAASNESQRRSFALMAYAGLRPNEVRALRRRDVRLRWENGEPVGGFVSVREGRSHDTLHTPKTGQREIPIPPLLARQLASVESAARDVLVALTRYGKPWGQFGLDQAFERVRDRIGLEGWSVYCLRHYAITSWLRAGIPVHVVQRMAGHTNLSTTQRYVHHLKEDLDDAALRLARFAERLEEARGNGSGNDRGHGHGNSVETGSPKQPGKHGRKR
jgi:integrase